jgi:hypothetical protein
MAFTCYECPKSASVIHNDLFPDVLGLFKIPNQMQSSKSSSWFGVLLLLKDNDNYKLVPATREIYDSTCRSITTTTRPVMIEVLKIAIKNTTENIFKRYPLHLDHIYKPMRDLYMDALLHTEIYLEELMQEEAAERLQQRAVAKIQSAFLEAITVPTHPFCQRRLLREFQEMTVVV